MNSGVWFCSSNNTGAEKPTLSEVDLSVQPCFHWWQKHFSLLITGLVLSHHRCWNPASWWRNTHNLFRIWIFFKDPQPGGATKTRWRNGCCIHGTASSCSCWSWSCCCCTKPVWMEVHRWVLIRWHEVPQHASHVPRARRPFLYVKPCTAYQRLCRYLCLNCAVKPVIPSHPHLTLCFCLNV